MIKFVAVAILCAVIANSQDSSGVKVMKATAETDDGIAFQISVRKKVYAADENIDVYYVVRNNSRRTVYLVTKQSDKLRIPESWVVELPDPIEAPDAHYPYRYKMIRILPGKSYSGKRTVAAKKLEDHPKYGFNVVEIQVGFAYLFDVAELKGCNEASYSLPCLSEVDRQARIVKLGNLVVERKVE